MFFQHGARPFPHPAEVALTGQLAAGLGDGQRMPMLEAHVRAVEVDEEIARRESGRRRDRVGRAVRETALRWRFLDAVVYEMPAGRTMLAWLAFLVS